MNFKNFSVTIIALLGFSSSAQQPPARAALPPKVGQIWLIESETPSGVLRWKLQYSRLDAQNLPFGTANNGDVTGQAGWIFGKERNGFLFSETPGRFGDNTGLFVCVFPKYIDEFASNNLQGNLLYQDGKKALTGGLPCLATLIEDTNPPLPAIPTAPAFNEKTLLPAKAGQQWKVSFADIGSWNIQLIGFSIARSGDYIIGPATQNTTKATGGFKMPSSAVPDVLGEFFIQMPGATPASCALNTLSKLEVKDKTYVFTGFRPGVGSLCQVSFTVPAKQ